MLRSICCEFTFTGDIVVEPYMELLRVMRCSFRELKAFKKIGSAVKTHRAEAFLAVWASAAREQQSAGTFRRHFPTIGAWLFGVSEHNVSRHLLHGSG
jgi:hypothetical protein